MLSKGMGWRDVGRSNGRDRSRARTATDGRRHQYLCLLRVLVGTILKASHSGGGSDLLSLVVPPGVGIVVNTRMSGQLIRSTEAFTASGKLACMRFLSRVRTDMSRLVLQPVKGAVAQGAFVWSWEILSRLFGLGLFDQRGGARGSGHGGRLGLLEGRL